MFYGDNITLDNSLEQFLTSLKNNDLIKLKKGFNIVDIVVSLEKSGYIEIDDDKLENIVLTGDSNE